ncbi:unnamed protein product [Rhizophagus irregularis]|nr:unnamed protein product [Rhizophagus irregularis]
MIDKWINYQDAIIKLKDKYELVTSDTVYTFLDNTQFHSYLDELNEIRKQLRIVFKLELNIMEQEQIISNIKKRCDSYKEDQGRMIQSITEKEMVSISIEKIYKKDHNGNEVLITDENQADGKEQYKPQPHINENIYSSIMDVPSYDEWLDIIRQLSNGKATGPSGVSNEMLKHLSNDCNHILYYLICKIIELGYYLNNGKKRRNYSKSAYFFAKSSFSNYLKDNNVLKANQFAGLPKQSTFEPIRVMNEVIQDSIDNNNELWILSQDMGKAYDQLFKDRKNQVITAYGKTAPYDVLTGIDQGEVISPLLWCIYYDPLLAEIDKQQLGYNVSCISKSVVQEEGVFNQQNVSIMAYMDDTQWITDDKSKLEKMLYIADTFYRLNNIQINKEKSELMMRATTEKRKYSHNYNDKVSIKFGREEINIKAKHPHEPMRILGVIIVPRVEYWSQVMALSKTQTEALIIPFRRIDFYDNQLQAKITDFCIQLNDNGLLGKITEIRLKSLQDQLWTSRPLIEKLPYNRVLHTRKNNYILNMLLLCYDNNISLQNLDINTFPTIKGGQIPLENIVDNAYYSKHRERLREKNILFLDQIISSDKSRLLLWKEILIKAYVPISSQRKEAKWYTDIRSLITSDNIHLNSNISQLFVVFTNNVDEARSYNIDKRNRSLVAFYNPQFNSVVIGKIQGIDNAQRLVIKHFMLICLNKYDVVQQALTQNHVIFPHLQDNIILDLLDSSTSRNDLLKIQQTLAPFDNSDYYIFEFYTDGSLIELGTEQCSISCDFAQISDLFDIPHVEFYSTIDKWPSAYRGELLAVLLVLSVVPKNSKVRINTDSLNANNNFLWAILCRIIITLHLHVEMFKVIAHGDDEGNNYVDNLAKAAHLDQDRYIVFKRDASMMKVLPCWNGILIENKLRSFLKNICNYKGLEKFVNLNRNSKYRQLEVDWTSTFSCLNCDISNNETSVSSSKTKAQKVHLLIEEIPTIEQMKKSLLDLYDGWMCPICGMQEETFNHVWTCSGHYDIINNIRDKTINHLLTWILEYNDNIQDFNNLLALDIWDISYDPNVFTFIELIKGIIPMSLSELLSSWTTKKNVVEVLIQMRQFIFNEIFENVWIPRCSHLKEFERSLGLTKKKKLEFKSVRSLPNNNSSNINIIHYDSLDSVRNYIYFGKNIIEFYTNLAS